MGATSDKNGEVKIDVKPTDDTSPDKLVPSDKMFDQDGNEIVVEPLDKGTPSDDGKGGGGDEPPLKPSDKKFKYKSQDEAETAYAEAERKMHEATTRASTLEKELAQLRKPPEKPASTVDDKIAEITSEAIKEIRALPAKFDTQGKETSESIEDRETKSAIIWGKANRKIAKMEYEESSKADRSEKEIAGRLYKKATSEGLSTDDELDLVGMEYGRTDPSKSADDRITDAVEAVKTRVAHLREGFVKKQKQDQKDKDDLKVLGGGSHGRPTDDGKGKKDSKPSDMFDALKDIKEKRKVKKDDLLG